MFSLKFTFFCVATVYNLWFFPFFAVGLIPLHRIFIVFPTLPHPAVSLGNSTPPALPTSQPQPLPPQSIAPPSMPQLSTTASSVTQLAQSPMANLMSITETLPPGSPRNGPSPPGPPPPRTASRGSQHSPNSSGELESISYISTYTDFFISKSYSWFFIWSPFVRITPCIQYHSY